MTKYIYEEKTAPSAPICVFQDGADDVPTKSLVVTIPPTLSGESSVTETQTGRNLVALNVSPQQAKRDFGITVNTQTADALNITSTGVAYACERLFYSFKKGTYAIKYLATSSDSYTPTISIYRTNGTGVKYSIQPNTLTTFTLSEDANIDIRLFASGSGDTTIRTVEYTNLQIEVGSTVSTYEPYNPTTYTASLGRTIYGGTADIVNGTGTDGYAKDSMTSTYLSGLSSSYIGYEASTNYFGGHPTIWVRNWNYQTAKIRQAGGIGCACDYFPVSMHNTDIINTQNRIYFDVNGKGISDVAGFITFVQNLEANNESLDIVYELETKTDFTFTGQEVPTRLGYNAFWSDEGDTEVTYYTQIPIEERYVIGGEILSDIADAIREKKESTAPILTEDMPDEIRSIEMGGSDLLDLASQTTFDFTDETYKTSALTIPDRMFNNNQRIRTVNISGIKTVESYAFIQCKATSLSFPDVETIGYQAFFQCRGASDVPLSIPNVVTIGEEAFKEAYVCGESPSYRFLDISKCVSIGNNAFRSTRINGFKMDSVETLGNMPWYGSWFSMTTVVFPKLKTAHDQMCRGMNFTNLVIGPDWESCGGGFAGYDMDWRNKYVYVYAVVPPTMGGDFSLWKPPVAFYVPADSVDAYKAAPYWSQYASIILPLPSDHLTIDTWL